MVNAVTSSSKATPALPATGTDAPQRAFEATLHAQRSSPAEPAWTAPFRSIEASRQRVHGMLADAMAGKRFSPAELLALQAGVYRLNTELELAAKVVEQTNGAVRRALATEV